MNQEVRQELHDLLVKYHASNPNLERWLEAVDATD